MEVVPITRVMAGLEAFVSRLRVGRAL